MVVGCTGGGSNFAGIAFPFIGRMLRGEAKRARRGRRTRRLSKPDERSVRLRFRRHRSFDATGEDAYAGSTFVPPGIHAGGLRYHGMAPLVSHLLAQQQIEAIATPQLETFAAGVQFAHAEGILPAPEANHAVAGAIREALRCKAEGCAALFCSTSAAMAILTCRPTPTILPASCRITSIQPPGSRKPSSISQR